MSYKSLLAVHPTHDSIECLASIVTLSQALDAHLDVLVINLASPIPTMAFVQNPDFDWSSSFTDILNETNIREKEVKSYLRQEGIDSTVLANCTQLGLIDETVTNPSLYADLVVFSGGASSFSSGMMAHALQGAIQSAGKPALILAGRHQSPPSDPVKVIIAWDEDPQAARAVHHSLPLLKRAQEVEILTIPEKNDEKDGMKRATSLKSWLLRHGINATVRIASREGRFVSHVLVEQVNQSQASLLVMGAYGHTRASERLFAGATYAALTKLETPLLLSQ